MHARFPNIPPSLDDENNYQLLNAEETDNVTRLRFKRRLYTCDKDDLAITVRSFLRNLLFNFISHFSIFVVVM